MRICLFGAFSPDVVTPAANTQAANMQAANMQATASSAPSASASASSLAAAAAAAEAPSKRARVDAEDITGVSFGLGGIDLHLDLGLGVCTGFNFVDGFCAGGGGGGGGGGFCLGRPPLRNFLRDMGDPLLVVMGFLPATEVLELGRHLGPLVDTTAFYSAVYLAGYEVDEVLEYIRSGEPFKELQDRFRSNPVYALAAVEKLWWNMEYVIVPAGVQGGTSSFEPYMRIARAAVAQDAEAVGFLGLQYEEVILEVLEREHSQVNLLLPQVRGSKELMMKALRRVAASPQNVSNFVHILRVAAPQHVFSDPDVVELVSSLTR